MSIKHARTGEPWQWDVFELKDTRWRNCRACEWVKMLLMRYINGQWSESHYTLHQECIGNRNLIHRGLYKREILPHTCAHTLWLNILVLQMSSYKDNYFYIECKINEVHYCRYTHWNLNDMNVFCACDEQNSTPSFLSSTQDAVSESFLSFILQTNFNWVVFFGILCTVREKEEAWDMCLSVGSQHCPGLGHTNWMTVLFFGINW